MDKYEGEIWDTSQSAEGLEFENNVVRRVEGAGLPEMEDTFALLHRQPVKLAPRSFTGQFIYIYICIYICMYVYKIFSFVYICIHIYIHIHVYKALLSTYVRLFCPRI